MGQKQKQGEGKGQTEKRGKGRGHKEGRGRRWSIGRKEITME